MDNQQSLSVSIRDLLDHQCHLRHQYTVLYEKCSPHSFPTANPTFITTMGSTRPAKWKCGSMQGLCKAIIHSTPISVPFAVYGQVSRPYECFTGEKSERGLKMYVVTAVFKRCCITACSLRWLAFHTLRTTSDTFVCQCSWTPMVQTSYFLAPPSHSPWGHWLLLKM